MAAQLSYANRNGRNTIVNYFRPPRGPEAVPSVKFSHALDDGDTIKISIPIYNNGPEQDLEDYYNTIKIMKHKFTAVGVYPDDPDDDDFDATALFVRTNECFDGSALTIWEDAVAQADQQNFGQYKECIDIMTETLQPPNATHDILKYLRTTKKPRDMSYDKWQGRMKIISQYVGYTKTERGEDEPFLDENAVTTQDRKEYTYDNVPQHWRDKFDLSALSLDDEERTISAFFRKVEEQEEREKRREDSKKQGRFAGNTDRQRTDRRVNSSRTTINDIGSGRGVPRNEEACPFPGHNHRWGECNANRYAWRNNSNRRQNPGGAPNPRRSNRNEQYVHEEEYEETELKNEEEEMQKVPEAEVDDEMEYIQENVEEYDAQSLDSDVQDV